MNDPRKQAEECRQEALKECDPFIKERWIELYHGFIYIAEQQEKKNG